MNLQVTFGDLLVAITAGAAVIACYYAFKGQIEAFKIVLTTFEGRLDAHATRLRQYSADIRYNGRRVSALEGRVFSRRVDDRTPGERSDEDNNGEEQL